MFRIDRAQVNIKPSAPPHLLLMPNAQKTDDKVADMPVADDIAADNIKDTFELELPEVDMQACAEAQQDVELPEVQPEPESVAELPEPIDTEAILREANEKAEEIIDNAQAQCDELKNQAWQEGYSQGKAEAREELKQQRLMQKEELCALIERVTEERSRLLEEVQDDVVRLSVDIARKILQYELDYGNESFVSLVRNAISQMKAEGRVVVRVSPQEYARYFSDESSREFNSDNMKVTVIEDNYLERGGCIIEAEGETINASVESQLKTISIGFGRQVG